MKLKLLTYKFKKFIKGYGTVATFKINGRKQHTFQRINPDNMRSYLLKLKAKETREKGYSADLHIIGIAPIRYKDYVKMYGGK